MFRSCTAAMFVPYPPKGTNMALYKSGRNSSANNAQMKNSRDLNLGAVVYILIIFHIQVYYMTFLT